VSCRALLELLKHDIKPRDIMTKQAFENAITVVMALGGSTNAVLHLLAMAHSVDVPLSIDDFQTISDRTPFIADLKPSGKYVMEDIHKVGDPFFVRSCSHVVRGTDTVLNSRDSAGLERTEVISLQTGETLYHFLVVSCVLVLCTYTHMCKSIYGGQIRTHI